MHSPAEFPDALSVKILPLDRMRTTLMNNLAALNSLPSPSLAPKPKPGHVDSLVHWLVLLLVVVGTALLLFCQLGTWPWDHDEVASLMELGLYAPNGPIPETSQFKRLPKLLPVWYGTQNVFLNVLPQNELGTRILSALCGILTIASLFIFARRWRGTEFALALVLLVGLNQCFVWLVQQNRFYSMALFFLTLSLGVIWWPTKREIIAVGLCAFLSILAVLSHNLLVVVFGIIFLASLMGLILGVVPISTFLRSGVAAGASAITYLVYLRPIMSGWVSGGTGGTNELVSFVAQLGPPTIALAFLGLGLSLRRNPLTSDLAWWNVVLVGGIMFVGLSPWLLGNWNPRYALFFMLPFWVVAAYGVEQVANRLPRGWGQTIWFAFVVLLLVPKLASHYRDGSRHDFRSTAALVAKAVKPNETIYCNWPMTLEYYLNQGQPVNVQWWQADALPDRTCLVVYASNALEPVLAIPQRRCDVLGEVGVRRFDEQSHVIRIYRVWSTQSSKEPGAPG
jgi:hypothetical protein